MPFSLDALTDQVLSSGRGVGAPTLLALRDNLLTVLAAEPGAPVLATAWHPYDMVTVGDGNDGKIYDFDVDGPATIVTTPLFEVGFQYIFTYEVTAPGGSFGGGSLYVQRQRAADGVWEVVTSSGLSIDPLTFNGSFTQSFPSRNVFDADNPASAMRLNSDRSFIAGKVFLYRRREYVTL